MTNLGTEQQKTLRVKYVCSAIKKFANPKMEPNIKRAALDLLGEIYNKEK